MSLWLWICLIFLFLVIFTLGVGVLPKKKHAVRIKALLGGTVCWIAVALSIVFILSALRERQAVPAASQASDFCETPTSPPAAPPPKIIPARLVNSASQAQPSNSIDTRALAARLSRAKVGDEISLPLSPTQNIRARVNLVQKENKRSLLGGSILDKPDAGFTLAVSEGGELSALLMLREENSAVRITPSSTKGRSTLASVPLSSLVCHRLPLSDETKQRLIQPRIMSAAADSTIEVPIRNSRPSATAVIYIDLDGEQVSDPAWNDGNPINATPHSHLTEDDMINIWQSVAEDYAPFDINVTTDVERYNNAPVGKRMRCIVTSNMWHFAGGVAIVDSFRYAGISPFSSTIPCWVFNTDIDGIKEAISHEVGHTLGLQHHGRSNPEEEYFFGHGTGTDGKRPLWAPIMGASYHANVSQWSKAEYQYANNPGQDDIAIIASLANGFGFIQEGPGDSVLTATPVTSPDAAFSHVITHSADADYYSLLVTRQSDITITAEPHPLYPNLDIEMELLDANLSRIAHDNPTALMNATLTPSLAPGTYYLKLNGTGRLDPLTTGYGNYGSIGQYTLNIIGLDIPDYPANPSPLPPSVTLLVGDSITLTASATGDPPPAYRWQYSTDQGNSWQDIPADNPHYTGADSSALTIIDAIAAMSGIQYRYLATNSLGSATSNPATLTIANSTTWLHDDSDGSGDWHDPINWSNGVPTFATTAIIPQGTAAIQGSFHANPGELRIATNATVLVKHNATLETPVLELAEDSTLRIDIQGHYDRAPVKITDSVSLGGYIHTDLSNAPSSEISRNIPFILIPSFNNLLIRYNRASPGHFYLTPSYSLDYDLFSSLYFLSVILPPIQSRDTCWANNVSGDWADPGNWDQGIPDNASAALIDQGHAITADNSSHSTLYLGVAAAIAANASLTLGNHSTIHVDRLGVAVDSNLVDDTNATLTLGRHSAIHASTHAILSETGNAFITLQENSTITAPLISIGDDVGTAFITLHPNSCIVTDTLNDLSDHRSILRFILTPDSSLDNAPLQVNSSYSLDAALHINAHAYTANATLPLIRVAGKTAPPTPANATIDTHTHASAALLWSSNNTHSTLSLNITYAPPDISFLSAEHHLIHAFTDNYELNPDGTPTTHGSLSHLPKFLIPEDGGNPSITFTALRSEYLYVVQQSLDMETWLTLQSIPGGSTTPSAVEANPPQGSKPPRLFMRVQVLDAHEQE